MAHMAPALKQQRTKQQQASDSPSDKPATGAWPYNRPCAQQFVGKYQSCMVIIGRLIGHAPVGWVEALLDRAVGRSVVAAR